MTDRRGDAAIAIALFVVSSLARIAFIPKQIFHGDSYGLAAGVLYTLTAHPPGFIGFCALVRVAYWFAGDVTLAFAIVNILATGAATALTFLAGRTMFDRRVGVIAAVLFATSLDTSYFSTLALSYAAEGAFATAAALTGWIAVQRRSFNWLVLHTIVLALGGSVRQTTLAFLFPLWIFVMWRAAPRWWQRIAAMIVIVLTVSIWSVPNADRLAKYWDQRRMGYFESVYNLQVRMAQYYDSSSFGKVQYEPVTQRFHWPLVELAVALWNNVHPPAADAPIEVRTASAANALRMLRYQIAKVAFYAALAAGLATPFVLLSLKKRVRQSIDATRWLFLVLWILPAALFFALNHLGAWGYLLIFLAALMILAARAITILLSPRAQIYAAAILALVPALVFLLMRPLPDTNDRNRVLNVAVLQYGAPSIRAYYARSRAAAFTEDPRQLHLDCVTNDCLLRSIPIDFQLPHDLKPVQPLRYHRGDG
ncbi:MAG TPA: glycosyltransferase family 39 protein [Thermoanaerobaculia bacterium]|nr:glycosyltransferase family 39 protein [Thermoanaerobaculia bacterium]